MSGMSGRVRSMSGPCPVRVRWLSDCMSGDVRYDVRYVSGMSSGCPAVSDWFWTVSCVGLSEMSGLVSGRVRRVRSCPVVSGRVQLCPTVSNCVHLCPLLQGSNQKGPDRSPAPMVAGAHTSTPLDHPLDVLDLPNFEKILKITI